MKFVILDQSDQWLAGEVGDWLDSYLGRCFLFSELLSWFTNLLGGYLIGCLCADYLLIG